MNTDDINIVCLVITIQPLTSFKDENMYLNIPFNLKPDIIRMVYRISVKRCMECISLRFYTTLR
jgi:hypothetical protein